MRGDLIDARGRLAVRGLRAALKGRKRILSVSHTRADGDGLGSALAFAQMTRRRGHRVQTAAEFGTIPEYSFMPGSDRVVAQPGGLWKVFDLVVSFDCGSKDRLGSIGEAIPPSIPIVNIDHHVSNTRFGTLNWIDASYASTTEMVYVLARALGFQIDRQAAENLYTGLYTDTGGFSFSNTSERTLRVAADLVAAGVKPVRIAAAIRRRKTRASLNLMSMLIRDLKVSENGSIAWGSLTRQMFDEAGHYPQETADYVDTLKSIEGVKLAILFRELREEPRIRVSFRTAEPVDGAALAALFGGGGHKRASGAMIDGGVWEVEKQVVDRAMRFVSENYGG